MHGGRLASRPARMFDPGIRREDTAGISRFRRAAAPRAGCAGVARLQSRRQHEGQRRHGQPPGDACDPRPRAAGRSRRHRRPAAVDEAALDGPGNGWPLAPSRRRSSVGRVQHGAGHGTRHGSIVRGRSAGRSRQAPRCQEAATAKAPKKKAATKAAAKAKPATGKPARKKSAAKKVAPKGAAKTTVARKPAKKKTATNSASRIR